MSEQSIGLHRWLQRLQGRSKLTRSDREVILSLPGDTLEVQANRDFVRLGEEATCSYIVNEGVVARYSQDRRGERQASAVFISGDAVLDTMVARDTCCTMTSLSSAELYCVPHDAILAALRSSSTLAEALFRDFAIDASIARKWLLNVSRHDARTRVAHLLCEFALRWAAVSGERDKFYFPVTQMHLADLVGLTAVHVNRVLRALREGGLVTVNRRSAQILNWGGLVAAGHFDPAYLHLPDRLIDASSRKAQSR